MQKMHSVRLHRLMFAVAMISILLLISACGGNPQTQQQANANKAKLDQLMKHAQAIGVPASSLQPILKQEQQLSGTSAPFTFFNDQSDTDYYQNLANHYNQLSLQLQRVITTSTQELQSQAQHDMQNFQLALSLQRSRRIGNISAFSQEFDSDQTLLAAAQYPKDYAAISKDAHKATQALDLIQPTFSQLTTFENTVMQMKQANLDITAMQTQYSNDMQVFNAAKAPLDYQKLSNLLNAQYQQAVVNSVMAIPYVGAAKLSEFQTQVNLLKTYGIDTSSYQKLFVTDSAAIQGTKTLSDYLVVSKKVDADIASMQDVLVQGEANSLVKQFHAEVDAWGKAHAYHDNYDGNTYYLDNGYMEPGIGSDLDNALSSASTPSDFQAVIDEANNALFNLHLLEADYNDPTPYNQVHATDLQMIDHYQLQHSQILLISLVEQAMRVYQNGKLVRSFIVTTGRQELPSPPGVWTVLNRQSPTVFTSQDPPNSPYWYPPTPIQYAILYHSGGYFVHDAWWRESFGPGTQFPHQDAGGTTNFNFDGSHGCVNMQSNDAAWVYNNTDWNTLIVIY